MTSEVIEINRIILSSSRKFSIKDNFISKNYNIGELGMDFFDFLDDTDIYNNLLENVETIETSEKNFEQQVFLKQNAPAANELLTRDLTTKSKVSLFIPCVYICQGCQHTHDFKIKKCLENHLCNNKTHGVDSKIAKIISKEIFDFALNKYERLLKKVFKIKNLLF